jgi:hypothetical protein
LSPPFVSPNAGEGIPDIAPGSMPTSLDGYSLSAPHLEVAEPVFSVDAGYTSGGMPSEVGSGEVVVPSFSETPGTATGGTVSTEYNPENYRAAFSAPSNEARFLMARDPRVTSWYDPGAEHLEHPIAQIFGGEETRLAPAGMNLRKAGLEGELRKYELYLIRNGMSREAARQVISDEIESNARDVIAAPFSRVFKPGFSLYDIDQ